jgi:capsular polysaccharide transport system permease protein
VLPDLWLGNPHDMHNSLAEPADFTPAPPPQEPKSRRFRTARVVLALILREIGSHDSRSSIGFLWSIIEPILTVIVLTMAFSLLTRNPRLGTNFPLYYVSGMVSFHIYAQVCAKVAGSVKFSRTLLGFPSVTVLDTLNSVLFLMWPLYDSIWGVFSRPMVVSSGALILIDDLPTWLFHILWWNPMAHMVAEVRRGFYPTYDAPWVSIPYVLLFCGITFMVGLVMLQRKVYDVLDK